MVASTNFSGEVVCFESMDVLGLSICAFALPRDAKGYNSEQNSSQQEDKK